MSFLSRRYISQRMINLLAVIFIVYILLVSYLYQYDNFKVIVDRDDHPYLITNGHQDGLVNLISWSADGLTIATADDNGTTLFWGLKILNLNISESWRLRDGPIFPNSIEWSPDNKYIAMSYNSENNIYEKTFYLRNSTDLVYPAIKYYKKDPGQFSSDHQQSITSLSWDPTANYIAIGWKNGTIGILDIQNNMIIKKLNYHNQSINAVSWSPDGDFIAGRSDDNSISIWKTSNYNLYTSLNGEFNPNVPIYWGNAGGIYNKTLAFLSINDNKITLWDIFSNKITYIANSSKSIDIFNWSPNGEYIATGVGRYANIWTMENENIQSISTNYYSFKALSWNPNSTLIAIAARKGIEIWDPIQSRLVVILPSINTYLYWEEIDTLYLFFPIVSFFTFILMTFIILLLYFNSRKVKNRLIANNQTYPNYKN